jgi:nucleoside-diphosphate-sugar epimerase
MRELAASVVEAAGELFAYKGSVVFENNEDAEYLTDNPNRRRPVICKARSDLDFNPTIGLQDGIRRSLIWYSGNREAEAA